MSLILTVLSFKNQPISETNTVSISSEGGSIGRSDDNTLVLPDTEKFVSRHHATIKAENGYYYLSDTSLSGVYINGAEPALHNATERIDNGTLLRIGEYEIAVAIADESMTDDFPFVSNPITPRPRDFLVVDEPWVESESMGSNSLMTDNFPSHEELVQKEANTQPADFQSRLQGNQSPLFDSYIAPSIISSSSTSSTEEIPANFSFDDLFSASDLESQPTQPINKPTVNDDFADFFGAAINDMAAENDLSTLISETSTESTHEISESVDLFANNDELPLSSSPTPSDIISDTLTEHKHEVSAVELADEEISSFAIEPPFSPSEHKPAKTDTRHEDDKINTKSVAEYGDSQPSKTSVADGVLFNAFLQGVAVKCEIHPEQQTETLQRIGLMFRKLIDGTIAVLRSRAEFKSLCRVNMTVIKATNNNPLKFTVSTDDVLRQLIENKTDGFLASTAAIEESFNDIMNHQLAMQAGIQASLTDLLKTFDPKIIEKQFEQGLVLQKKSKCWDSYEATYRNTVEDAVENFYGEAFVKAYEQQMSLLTKRRR